MIGGCITEERINYLEAKRKELSQYIATVMNYIKTGGFPNHVTKETLLAKMTELTFAEQKKFVYEVKLGLEDIRNAKASYLSLAFYSQSNHPSVETERANEFIKYCSPESIKIAEEWIATRASHTRNKP